MFPIQENPLAFVTTLFWVSFPLAISTIPIISVIPQIMCFGFDLSTQLQNHLSNCLLDPIPT